MKEMEKHGLTFYKKKKKTVTTSYGIFSKYMTTKVATVTSHCYSNIFIITSLVRVDSFLLV